MTSKPPGFTAHAALIKNYFDKTQLIPKGSIKVNENTVIKKRKSEEQKKKEYLWELFGSVELFCVCVAIIVLLFSFCFRLTIVDGQSMENTLYDKEYLMVGTAFYTPTQGDIVVVHDTSLEGIYGTPLIKRVIAVGGQTIDIDFDTWTVTVDGVVIDEPYIKLDPAFDVRSAWTYPLTLEEDEVFVMGDNRDHSGDSRNASIGPVDERCIVGKAFLRFYPFDRFGILENPFDAAEKTEN